MRRKNSPVTYLPYEARGENTPYGAIEPFVTAKHERKFQCLLFRLTPSGLFTTGFPFQIIPTKMAQVLLMSRKDRLERSPFVLS